MATVSVNTVLGEFRRGNDGFDFHGRFGDVAVVLDVVEADEAAALAQRVNATIGDLAEFARRIAAELANSFAPEGPVEVEIWEDGETVVSAAEFARRIRLDGITASSDGIELYFDDDGMFGGHAIRVWVDEAGVMTDAQIAG